MAGAEKSSSPERVEAQFDSLNTDIIEPKDAIDDTTVRPIPDSLRKWLKLPPYDQPPRKSAQEDPSK
jgi:hypothetical protein